MPLAWTPPAETRLLATAANTQYRLSAEPLPATVAHYQAQLATQGFVLDAESADARGWTARWRSRDGACLEIEAQPVFGVRAVRVVERAVACGT